MIGYNLDIENQKNVLFDILIKNPILNEVLQNAQQVELEQYYIGAGRICQTVWNYQNGFDLMYGISDIDFVYYDNDLSFDKENEIITLVKQTFQHLPIKLDIKNQARVHLWYKQSFGYEIKPYTSLESAINSWPTTATSIGVRIQDGKFVIYAPFGLNDMFGQIIRANKTQITQKIYQHKCEKWYSKWGTLNIVEW